MTNILNKPFTNKQYADFAVCANENNKRIEDYNGNKFALNEFEELHDDQIVDVSHTPEYVAKKQREEQTVLEAEIKKQIDELDKKRIRAMCEPAMKTETQSWLDYYTEQIQTLREQIH